MNDIFIPLTELRNHCVNTVIFFGIRLATQVLSLTTSLTVLHRGVYCCERNLFAS